MLIGWSLFIVIGGCTHQQNLASVSSQTITMQPGEGKYSKEISEHEERARSAPETSERMQAHLKLARLYTSYKNPQRNYKKLSSTWRYMHRFNLILPMTRNCATGSRL